MYKILTVALYSLILLTINVSGKDDNNKQKASVGPKTERPDDKLFQDQAAFCEGCYAVVQELYKLLKKWKKEPGSLENHIDAAFVSLCSNDRLRSYVLSPPKMTRLCSGLLAHYNDEIASAVFKVYGTKTKPTADQLFQTVCTKSIPACPKKMQPMTVVRNKAREDNSPDPITGGQVIKNGEQVEVKLDDEGNTKTTKTSDGENKKSNKKSTTEKKKRAGKEQNVKDEL